MAFPEQDIRFRFVCQEPNNFGKRSVIDDLAKLIPDELWNKSGSVFYSGRSAFSEPGRLYILGLNPGGDPAKQARETVARHTRNVLMKKPALWSEYSDESWCGYLPGRRGMQPRVVHLLNKLGLEPGEVPASNVIFLRSRREKGLVGTPDQLAETCWPFHRTFIERNRPDVILCFGKTAGEFVKRKTGAQQHVDEFVEANARHWKSLTFANRTNLRVVVATHPSIADWTNPKTDPSELVRRALEAC